MPTNVDYVLGVILKKEIALKSDEIAEEVEELIKEHFESPPGDELDSTQINRFIGIAYSSDNRQNLKRFIEQQAVKERKEKKKTKPWTANALNEELLGRIKEIVATDSKEVFEDAISNVRDSLGDITKEFECFFSWNNVPGVDSEKLRSFLVDNFGIDWAKDEEFSKSEDGKSINISKGENSAEITIGRRNRATLLVNNKKVCTLTTVKGEGDALNIYESDKANKREKLIQDVAIELLKRFATHFGIHYLYRAKVRE
jgi:hypothetical protein